MTDRDEVLKNLAGKLGIGAYTRHVLLCVGPNCCSPEEGSRAWEALKQEIADRGLARCYRTKVGCLRICAHGPTALVYPEGTWYHGMTAERIPDLVDRHLVLGRPLEDLAFAANPLSAKTDNKFL